MSDVSRGNACCKGLKEMQVVKAEGPQLIPGPKHGRHRRLLNSTSIPIDGQDTGNLLPWEATMTHHKVLPVNAEHHDGSQG